jgi:hypothetical protein
LTELNSVGVIARVCVLVPLCEHGHVAYHQRHAVLDHGGDDDLDPGVLEDERRVDERRVRERHDAVCEMFSKGEEVGSEGVGGKRDVRGDDTDGEDEQEPAAGRVVGGHGAQQPERDDEQERVEGNVGCEGRG